MVINSGSCLAKPDMATKWQGKPVKVMHKRHLQRKDDIGIFFTNRDTIELGEEGKVRAPYQNFLLVVFNRRKKQRKGQPEDFTVALLPDEIQEVCSNN